MNDPIPIPSDLKENDIIVLSNGERRRFMYFDHKDGCAFIRGNNPGILLPSGRAWASPEDSPFAVEIIRKIAKPEAGKGGAP